MPDELKTDDGQTTDATPKADGTTLVTADPAAADAAKDDATGAKPEVKTDDGKAADSSDTPAKDAADKSGGDKGGKDKADGAPAEYGDFTVPEGQEIDKAMLEKFSPLAKKLNLSQEQAQELVNFQTEVLGAQQQAWSETLETWQGEAKNDAEYGGEKFDASIGLAHKALDVFGNDALEQALDATGTGNHPELIRMLVNIGKAISDDPVHFGKAAGAKVDKTLAEKMYPNQNENAQT